MQGPWGELLHALNDAGEPPTHMGALFPPIHDLRRNSFKMFLEMHIKCNKAFEM